MTKTRFPAIGVVAAGLVMAFAQAHAAEPVATVSQINGITLVSQGADFVNASAGMALREGDRLMAMEGASATIKFNDGCLHTLADNAIFTVGSASSCTSGTLSSTQVGPYVAAAPAADIVGTGLITAGVVGTVVLLGATDVFDTGSDERQPVSP